MLLYPKLSQKGHKGKAKRRRPDPYIWFWIAASMAEIPIDNSNRIKTLLANGVSTLFINGKPTVINSLKIQ